MTTEKKHEIKHLEGAEKGSHHKQHDLGGHDKHREMASSEKKYSDTKDTKFRWVIALVVVGIIAVLLFLSLSGYKTEKTPLMDPEKGTLVMTINGEPVYSKDIVKKMVYLQAQYGPGVTDEFVTNLTINEMLIIQEAKKQGITVDEAEIDAAVTEWLGRLKDSVTTEQIDEVLAMANITFDEFIEDTRQAYRDNYLIFELLNRTVFSKLDLSQYDDIAVTEEDVLEEFTNNPDRYNQYNVSHILICYSGSASCTENRTQEEALTLINEIHGSLLEGSDFAELAKQHSDCSSASGGGELGWINKESEMDTVFIENAYKLKNVNQFSAPFLTQFGYHIIKLNGKMDKFEDFRAQISLKLQYEKQAENENAKFLAQQEAVDAYLKDLKSRADIIDKRQTEQANKDSLENNAVIVS